MAFNVKDWENGPLGLTPLSAASVEDVEQRLSDYVDEVAAGGVELGYASIAATYTQTGAGNSDVPGLASAVTVAARPIIVRFNADAFGNTTGAGITQLRIMEGATILAGATVSLTALNVPVLREVRLTPAPGAHTYKINLLQAVSGNSQIIAAADDPAFIQVIEV